ncbi:MULTISPECIES: hypothetical protein [unclassified Bradyrhizobium]|uniref:hypothetical protein n=1 Tax=unclassified Bradyrhizobium TaxID=2631580 RepID=UPI0029166A2C|nr:MULTISPECIES: hypothetical protein [unclassified Bradyrhizobium]
MARLQQKKQAAVTTGSAGSSGIPCAMGYDLYAISRCAGLFGHRIATMRVSARCAGISVGMPGPRDFAVRIDSRSSNGINASTASRAQRP